MITTVVTVTSTFLAGSFGAAAVASLILFLIMRELTSAHAEETGSVKSKVLSHTLLIPITPLLVVFPLIVALKGVEAPQIRAGRDRQRCSESPWAESKAATRYSI